MNLAIYKPKKDQCKTCVAFQNKTPNDEEKKEQEKHLKKKKRCIQVEGQDQTGSKKRSLVGDYNI